MTTKGKCDIMKNRKDELKDRISLIESYLKHSQDPEFSNMFYINYMKAKKELEFLEATNEENNITYLDIYRNRLRPKGKNKA